MLYIMYKQLSDCLEGLKDCLRGVYDGAMWLDDGMGGGCGVVVWWGGGWEMLGCVGVVDGLRGGTN